MKPRVTVAMSVCNGERFLREAIDSVLTQTFTDFEFIIVDDGSTDSTGAILEKYRDPRIDVMTNGENLGLTRSLNNILGRARGAYVARMDADDVSMPKRLEKQVAYLDRHPEVGVLGTRVERLDEAGRRSGVVRIPTRPTRLRWRLLLGNPMAHPSVMFRRSLVVELGGYDDSLGYAQDHDLWARTSSSAQVANLPEPLLRLRRHGRSISATHLRDQRRSLVGTTTREVEALLGRDLISEDVACLMDGPERKGVLSAEAIARATALLLAAHRAFTERWRPGLSDRLYIGLDVARRIVAISGRAEAANRDAARSALVHAALADPRVLVTRPFLAGLARMARG